MIKKQSYDRQHCFLSPGTLLPLTIMIFQIILRSCFDKKKLLDCLQNIVIHEMGLEYDLNNEKHNNDIQLICDKIIQVYSVQSDMPSV